MMSLLRLILFVAALLGSRKSGICASELKSLESNSTNRPRLVYSHYRLPTSVRPEKYKLKIITHLEGPSSRFDGEVQIQLSVFEDTNNITLHAQNLTIKDSRIELKLLQDPAAGDDAGAENCIKSVVRNKRRNYLIMQLCSEARKGEEYLLSIPFSGVISDDPKGYYRSSYPGAEKKEIRWLAVTNFEPTSARRAFPCFDEPSFKANFTVILGHKKQYTALSNMPLKDRTPMSDKEDWIWSEFEESVPMSTYLVAYTVNDFAYKPSETTLKNKVLFRTWARPDAIEQCNYAGEIGPRLLRFYEDTFNVSFPLSKIDQIAIPDFSIAAMENWGLPAYREEALLYSEGSSSLASKQRISTIVAHQLTQQWFGNLVTMKWWSDFWLKEGFASYMATLGVNHLRPDKRLAILDSVENLIKVFQVDALLGSRPISQTVVDTSQLKQIFDSISQKKASSVFRMMHSSLGDHAFWDGIQSYLKKHSYANAEQDDLWKSLTESAHATRVLPENYDIKTIMDSWTLQTGYPIITVTRDYQKRTATITQSRYLINSNLTLRSAEQSCWWVPLTYTTKSELSFEKTVPKTWLECDAEKGAVTKELKDMPAEDEWVLFNLQMSGIYQVKYDQRNWNMLMETLTKDDHTKIDAESRAYLITNAFSLALSRHQSFDEVFRLISYLPRERDYLPWKAALKYLISINEILRGTRGFDSYKKYIVNILTPIYLDLHGLNTTNIEKDGLETDSQGALQHKILIASWACGFGIEDCVKRSLSYFKEWRRESKPDTRNPIPKDLRAIVYCNALRYRNSNWDFLTKRYKNSNVPTEKLEILQTLPCTRIPLLIEGLLEAAYRPSRRSAFVRKQDASVVLKAVLQNFEGLPLGKKFITKNFEFLQKFHSSDPGEVSKLIQTMASRIYNRRDYEDLKELIEGHKNFFSKMEYAVSRALDTAEAQCNLKEESSEEITRALKKALAKKG